MPQCKLFGETPAGLLDPIDLQHPALGRTWTRPLAGADTSAGCSHILGRTDDVRAHRRHEGVEPSR